MHHIKFSLFATLRLNYLKVFIGCKRSPLNMCTVIVGAFCVKNIVNLIYLTNCFILDWDLVDILYFFYFILANIKQSNINCRQTSFLSPSKDSTDLSIAQALLIYQIVIYLATRLGCGHKIHIKSLDKEIWSLCCRRSFQALR